jgi:hypothetical protein
MLPALKISFSNLVLCVVIGVILGICIAVHHHRNEIHQLQTQIHVVQLNERSDEIIIDQLVNENSALTTCIKTQITLEDVYWCQDKTSHGDADGDND